MPRGPVLPIVAIVLVACHLDVVLEHRRVQVVGKAAGELYLELVPIWDYLGLLLVFVLKSGNQTVLVPYRSVRALYASVMEEVVGRLSVQPKGIELEVASAH